MAKKEKKQQELNADEAMKRLEKYEQAKIDAKNGKKTVLSILGFSLILFLIILIVLLKLKGVGKTIVFDSTGENTTVYSADTDEVEGTNIADALAGVIQDGLNRETTESTTEQ